MSDAVDGLREPYVAAGGRDRGVRRHTQRTLHRHTGTLRCGMRQRLTDLVGRGRKGNAFGAPDATGLIPQEILVRRMHVMDQIAHLVAS